MKKFDSRSYLANLNIDVMRFGLETIAELLRHLGEPQNSFPSILIAGTNGKGSTAAMTASILRSAGYKTGLYTSPHLIDVRERIVVNGKMIPCREFDNLLAHLAEIITVPATYFEIMTAAAFLYFQRQQVDIAVLEVGLGGRLDATNICRPLVSVITNIARDHMACLGNTLEAIAREKAGIIKQNGICLTGTSQTKALNIIAAECRRLQSGLYRLGVDFKITGKRNGLLTYAGRKTGIDNLTIPLIGSHQIDNAALALAALEAIEPSGFSVTPADIRRGLQNTKWPGRLEVLQKYPLFIVDGAHNPAGIRVLCRALRNDFSYRRLILIFAVLADKEYLLMLQKIAPLADKIIITGIESQRAIPADELYAVIRNLGFNAKKTVNVKQALAQAFRIASSQDLICAAGSLYLAAAVKQSFPETTSCDKKNQLPEKEVF